MLPILGALVLQAADGAVDLLVVGRFGSTSGLSAVSTGSQVLNLVTFVVTPLAMGITVLIARYLGEKRPQYIGQVIGGAAIVFTLLATAPFVVMVFFARLLSRLQQAPAPRVGIPLIFPAAAFRRMSAAVYTGAIFSGYAAMMRLNWSISSSAVTSGSAPGVLSPRLTNAAKHCSR